MDIKKLTLAAVAGGITMFILGGLFYEVLLKGFFMDAAGQAAGAYRAEPIIWAIILGELSFATLVAYIFQRWATIKTFMGGLKGGAVIGLLIGLGINLVFYGTTTLMEGAAVIVDPLITVIRLALAGGVIGWLLGRE